LRRGLWRADGATRPLDAASHTEYLHAR
jgi:hypothetical protein